MKKLLKEPLLHFLLAGGLLFATYAWVNQSEDNESRVVRITTAEVAWLKETWARQWSRQPDAKELRSLVGDYLKQELLVHEARELGLELDDIVVRRRLAQKMEFLVQDVASFAEPDDASLLKLYDTNKALYQSPARVSFTQIYFKNEASALQGLDKLKDHDVTELGDSSLLPPGYEGTDEQAVTSVFGPDFSAKIFALESGHWQGPVASGYGFHLVRVSEHQAAQTLPFEKVRKRVLEEWQHTQQDKAKEQFFSGLLQKYDVVLDEDVASLLGQLTGALQ